MQLEQTQRELDWVLEEANSRAERREEEWRNEAKEQKNEMAEV